MTASPKVKLLVQFRVAYWGSEPYQDLGLDPIDKQHLLRPALNEQLVIWSIAVENELWQLSYNKAVMRQSENCRSTAKVNFRWVVRARTLKKNVICGILTLAHLWRDSYFSVNIVFIFSLTLHYLHNMIIWWYYHACWLSLLATGKY